MVFSFSMPHNEGRSLSVYHAGSPKFGEFFRQEDVFMYAVIATGGKQYKVSEGDVIKVEKLGIAAGETVTFDQVLVVNDGSLKVGNPTVNGATVSASVVEEGKFRKVIVYRYKNKTGYHKKNGHRQAFTKVKIDKINA